MQIVLAHQTTNEVAMSRKQLLQPPWQGRLEFTSNTIGRRFSRAVDREVQALLAQLLVEVIRLESDNDPQGGEHERQDP